MKVYDAILKRRTIRKFKNKKVPLFILKKCINAARMSASSSNLQPLEYVVVNDERLLNKVYEYLEWAVYIPGFDNSREKPKAYIVILVNKNIRENADKDVGIAAENIALVAFESGLGSCMIGSIDRKKLRKVLNIPKYYEISLVMALGYPAEKSKTVDFKNSVKYYYEDKKNLIVPKRKLKDILHINEY